MPQNAAGATSRAAHLALAEGYAAEILAAKRLAPTPATDRPGHVLAFRNVEVVA